MEKEKKFVFKLTVSGTVSMEKLEEFTKYTRHEFVGNKLDRFSFSEERKATTDRVEIDLLFGDCVRKNGNLEDVELTPSFSLVIM